MTDTQTGDAAPEAIHRSPRVIAAGATLLALIATGDILFFLHAPGISLAFFALAVIAGVVALNPLSMRREQTMLLAIVAILAALPFAESNDVIWMPMALGAVSLFALSAVNLLPQFEHWFGVVLRFALLAPVRLAGDGFALLRPAGQNEPGGRLLRALLVWIVPLVSAAVFALLFVVANPVLEAGFHAIRLETLFQLLDPRRVVLWGLIAAVAWPVLMPKILDWTSSPAVEAVLPQAESVVFGATAIRNSLIVFNLLFAMQTLMDLAFLWGGVRLPEGMTHADYAHRGAYPLIVTALLAAAFVLAAMQPRGSAQRSPLIRWLVYLWIGQNVWLVVSSILRLDLYVEAYSLTELRLAAGIWMGLVAAGLLLILARIVLGRTNRWLVMANLTTLALTLFGTSLLNFPATIAKFNVEHSLEIAGEGQRLDYTYMSGLGPEAIPAIDEFLTDAKGLTGDVLKSYQSLRIELVDMRERQLDWQSWTWRQARLDAYLVEHPYAPAPAGANR